MSPLPARGELAAAPHIRVPRRRLLSRHALAPSNLRRQCTGQRRPAARRGSAACRGCCPHGTTHGRLARASIAVNARR
eukprot:1074637-Pleurochrysis_carterae.AAC.2